MRFNPRPRAGGDFIQGEVTDELNRFQSAPPCGGRRLEALAERLDFAAVSIRAPVRGATLSSALATKF